MKTAATESSQDADRERLRLSIFSSLNPNATAQNDIPNWPDGNRLEKVNTKTNAESVIYN
jgi:hypothetical protein